MRQEPDGGWKIVIDHAFGAESFATFTQSNKS